MSSFNFAAFIKALRVRRGSIPQDLYDDLVLAAEMSKAGAPTFPIPATKLSPVPWVGVAESMLGLREIPGAKHNPRILEMWAAAKAAWFKDDETPWCGAFIAYCMVKCGIAPPKEAPRAASWAEWGKACPPQLGAVGVKKRVGGNHVFLIVGMTQDGKYYKALGGNQGNMVSIVDIAVAEVHAVRWPASEAALGVKLPIMPRGTIGGSES